MTFQKYTGDLESELWLASRPGTQWHLECIDRTGGVIGPWSSIALSPAGEPSVAYFIGYPSYDLRFAERVESHWNSITIHSEGETGYGARLLFDGQGNPIISHGDVSNKALLLSRRRSSDWSTEVLRADQQVGPHLAMSLNRNSDAYIAHRSGVSPTALALTTIEQGTSRWVTVDAEGDVGYEPSLALDPGGHPWIAYRGGRDRLTIAFEQDQTWRTVDIEAAGIGINHASIAFDPAGRLGVAVAPRHEAGVLFGWIDKVPLTPGASSPLNP